MPVTLDKLRDWIYKDPTLDPFSPDFDKGKLAHRMSVYKKFDDKAAAFAAFVTYAHELYTASVARIVEQFFQLGKTGDDLLESLFGHLNTLESDAHQRVTVSFKKLNTIPDYENIHYHLFQEQPNESISIAGSQQIFVDSLSELSKHLPASTMQTGATPGSEKKILTSLFVWGNVICNLRDTCFAQFLHDNSWVDRTGTDSLKITRQFPMVEKIRTAAEIRDTNKHVEIESTLQMLLAQKEAGNMMIGTVNAKGEIEEITIQPAASANREINAQAVLLKYHPHLAQITLSSFDNLTLSILTGMLASLFDLFATCVASGTEQNAAIFVNRKLLTQKLARCCDVSETVCNQFIACLTCNPSSPYFWRSPFYAQGDRLYFPMHVLTSPNIHLFIERLIGIEGHEPLFFLRLFKDFSLLECNLSHQAGFELSVFEPRLKNEVADIFISNFCMVTRDTLVLAELFCYDYPLELDEHASIFHHLSYLSGVVKRKATMLEVHFPEKTEGKKIFPVIVTDYPHYSGMVMNDVPVLDLGLLHHYYFTGCLRKVASPLAVNSKAGKEIARLDYYTTEDEFNNNLKSFLWSPPPITQYINNMVIADKVISQPFLPVSITIEMVRYKGEEKVLWEKIDSLEQMLAYDYFGDPKEERKEAVTASIQYELSIVLHRLAFARYTPYDERWGIINAAIQSRHTGIAHLIYYLTRVTDELPKPGPPVFPSFETVPLTDAHDVNALHDRLRQSINKEISFPGFVMPAIFSGDEERLLISAAVALIDHQAYQKIDDKDINFLLFNLLILYGLREKYSLASYFHTGVMNLIDLLNQSHHYQKARDVSEEFLSLAINDGEQWFGWYILFTCYSGQSNLEEAALYGCLFFTSIRYSSPVNYRILLSGAFALMKFMRNFGFDEFAIAAYRTFSQLELHITDRLKFAQVYFSILVKNIRDQPVAIDELFVFLDQHSTDITNHGTRTSAPWLALLYNVKRYQERNLFSTSRPIHEYIARLEKQTDPAVVRRVRNIILGNAQSGKAEFIQILITVFETRIASDLVHELSNLSVPAFHLLRSSMANNDTEGILLASIALSDQSLVFDEGPAVPFRAPLIKPRNSALHQKIKHYQQHLLSTLELQPGQVFVWIFTYEENYGYLIIDAAKKPSATLLTGWMEDALWDWMQTISRFYFNSGNIPLGEFDLSAQEKDYQQWLRFFSSASLPTFEKMSELLVCKSLEMTDLPHNLLVSGNDFIAAQVPVCNVFSPEFFSRNHHPVHIPAGYRIDAWIPTEEDDYTVGMGHGILEPVLTRYQANVITSRYPEVPLSGDINIFLAHGIRDLSGFKTVRTSDDPLSSILQPSRIFGSGKIAVLFICNSGSVAEEHYARQVKSLSTQLIKASYEAVVASYWPYDVTMANRWLSVFLESIDKHESVNRAVFLANKSLAGYDPDSSTVFFAPAGQFAMHLYGNPNVRVGE